MKKILIVSAHFPPLNSMAAKRYGYMCKYMEENGYIPYVLTQKARGGSYLNSKLDLESPIPDERIIRIGTLGMNYPIDDPYVNMLCSEYKKNNVYSRIVDEQALGWFYKVRNELCLDDLPDIDIVLGTFPDIRNLYVAGYLAKELDIPYVAEIRDLISDYNEGSNRNGIWKDRELNLEQSVLNGAAGIITVTQGFTSILHNRYPNKKIGTVYNGWDSKDFAVTKNMKLDSDYLYYAGSLYEHRLKSLMLLIDVIYEYGLKIKIKIRSVGPEILEAKLKSYINNKGLEGNIEVLPSVSEKIVKIEQTNARINLVISSIDAADIALMSTIPGKVFELIKMDAPVLTIADKKCEISAVLEETHKGKVLCDKEDIKDFLISGYKSYVGYGKNVDSFSRRKQTKVLCQFLDEILEEDYKMKDSIFAGLATLGGVMTGATVSGLKLNKIIAERQNEKEKFRIMYQLMERWMRLKEQGREIEIYFDTYGYKNIAIYGLGDIGKHLLNELKDSNVNVVYGIDKNTSVTEKIKIVSPDSKLEPVDVIVVTAIAYFDEIDEMLSEKINCPIISLEDIIYELV